jgi:hypothetical protein
VHFLIIWTNIILICLTWITFEITFCFQLFKDVSPLAAENFRALCTGILSFNIFLGKYKPFHWFLMKDYLWRLVLDCILTVTI